MIARIIACVCFLITILSGACHAGPAFRLAGDGKPAVVTVRVLNDSVDDLGVRGIIAPVMFYSPKP